LPFASRAAAVQSGDGDGSTSTLMLVPVSSGAATTTPDLPGNLRADLYCFFPKA
jgi:hypothetical protein